jgi:hypothetical protein
MNVEEFLEDEKCMLFVLGSLHQLEEWGLINVDSRWVSIDESKGLSMYDQLEASGYRPARLDVIAHLKHLVEDRTPGMDRNTLEALTKFISGWDELKVFLTNNPRMN